MRSTSHDELTIHVPVSSDCPTFVPRVRGALGAGLAIFTRFPIIETAVYPYSLNGAPIDVAAGDWFVGKAAASATILHPLLGKVQVFNTHVSYRPLLSRSPTHSSRLNSYTRKAEKMDLST